MARWVDSIEIANYGNKIIQKNDTLQRHIMIKYTSEVRGVKNLGGGGASAPLASTLSTPLPHQIKFPGSGPGSVTRI